uniref:Sideroflexin-2 n=1 Tax=Syphacia muris TaxID=451379 RepID=A0A0N5AWW2_9BILA
MSMNQVKHSFNNRSNFGTFRWDQSTFYGRLRHFASITNPAKVFAKPETLYNSKKLLELYKTTGKVVADNFRKGEEPKGTTLKDIFRAQAFYGSAFHPDTGELQNLLGRMCFQVPGGTFLLGAMLIWYRSTPAVIFWQWVNQSFCALLNYTNRNAKSPLTNKDLLVAYSSAVTGAVSVAVGLKYYFAKIVAPPLIQRLVPFSAVAVANAINLPLMRQNELKNGVMVSDDEGNELVPSKCAAYKGIIETLISRTVLVGPPLSKRYAF